MAPGPSPAVPARSPPDLPPTSLPSLGAAEVLGRLEASEKPLQSQKWAGVVDTVGGATLANAIAQVRSRPISPGGLTQVACYPPLSPRSTCPPPPLSVQPCCPPLAFSCTTLRSLRRAITSPVISHDLPRSPTCTPVLRRATVAPWRAPATRVAPLSRLAVLHALSP